MKASSNRRRTKQEILEAKIAAQTKAAAIDEKLKMLDQIIQENAQIKAQLKETSEASALVEHLKDQGIIEKDVHGSWGPGSNYQGT